MPQNPDDRPNETPNAPLDPAAHREQLLKKLNCLIAVLEAAIAKVRKSQQDGLTDPDRLERIRVNLENTLTICQRAKITLERRGTLPSNLPPEVREAVGVQGEEPRRANLGRRKNDHRMSYRDYVELSSFEEFRKFREMRPISSAEISAVDFDRLADDLAKPQE